ncbi:TolB family protein [Armatimonas sp.]|uniref:TolB family protein n=1 Tax=Armatimonas sp. TaxID=1872638 RepID=UPI00375102F9
MAFRSVATNLVVGDTNGVSDIFVHDRTTGITTRVSVATGGAQAVGGNSNNPSISADGRYVAFSSTATNLVPGDTNGANDVFVHDRVLGTTTLVSDEGTGTTGNGLSDSSAISGDGNIVAFRSLATNLVGSPICLTQQLRQWR